MKTFGFTDFGRLLHSLFYVAILSESVRWLGRGDTPCIGESQMGKQGAKCVGGYWGTVQVGGTALILLLPLLIGCTFG